MRKKRAMPEIVRYRGLHVLGSSPCGATHSHTHGEFGLHTHTSALYMFLYRWVSTCDLACTCESRDERVSSGNTSNAHVTTWQASHHHCSLLPTPPHRHMSHCPSLSHCPHTCRVPSKHCRCPQRRHPLSPPQCLDTPHSRRHRSRCRRWCSWRQCHCKVSMP